MAASNVRPEPATNRGGRGNGAGILGTMCKIACHNLVRNLHVRIACMWADNKENKLRQEDAGRHQLDTKRNDNNKWKHTMGELKLVNNRGIVLLTRSGGNPQN